MVLKWAEKMKVLITGGVGFIGMHLARYIAKKNIEVVIADKFDDADIESDDDLVALLQQGNVTYGCVDLLDGRSLNRLGSDYTHIVHLAAIVGVQNVFTGPYNVLKNNNDLLVNVVDFAKKQENLDRFVFASTSEVYAGTLHHGDLSFPTPENSALILPSLSSKRTSYMLSKIYGEALCWQSDLPFTIIRPHNIYGPRMGMRHVIPELLKKIANSNNGELGIYSSEHSRTFCFVDDAVKMIFQLLVQTQSVREIFNVGNEGPEIKMKDLAKLICECVGKDLLVKDLGTHEGSPSRRVPAMDKLRSFVKLESSVPLYDGIRLCHHWYKKNGYYLTS